MIRPTFLLTSGLLAVACSTPKSKIVVPGSAMNNPGYENQDRYVIRMSDGIRDWEVELPESNGGYEVRIPVSGEGEALVWDPHRLTDPDKELLRALGREATAAESAEPPPAPPPKSGENVPVDALVGGEPEPAGASAAEVEETTTPQSPPSYMMGIEEVNRLYRAGQYELALVSLSRLERAYPEDVKILAMKGTLWLRLGRPELAREAWEQVLRIDPDNRAVLNALRQLGS